MITKKYTTAELNTLVNDFLRDGFCLLPGFIDQDKIAQWNREFHPLFYYHLEHHADPSFRGPNRYYVTLPFKAPFADAEIFEHDGIVAIMQQIAGPDFVMCQLASDTPMLGSDFQTLHSDARPLFPEEENVNLPSFQLALNFSLCDIGTANGPLEITRGTHRMNKHEAMAKIESGEIPLEPLHMKAGDVLIRDVRCLHRGTPNKTTDPRPMIVIGYSRSWFHRPEVSINIPRAEFEKLSPRARHMLRFNSIVDDLGEAPPPETYKTFAY